MADVWLGGRWEVRVVPGGVSILFDGGRTVWKPVSARNLALALIEAVEQWEQQEQQEQVGAS